MENKKHACPCRRKNCPRHGDCAACLAHHKSDPKYPHPQCKKKKKEK